MKKTAMLHMLDTDTASYIIKGRYPQVEAQLAKTPPDQLCLSVITRAELLYGLKSLPSTHRLHVVVHQFLNIIRIIPWDVDAADYYVEIRHQLAIVFQKNILE
jgi:tRNA(fMet)-specific endonuclease VapC